MTLIVKVIVRFVCAAIMLFGAYLTLHGDTSPGGGFAGGVMLASSFVLMTLAYGKETALGKFSVWWAAVCQAAGALILLLLATIGIFYGGFFVNFLPKGRYFAGTINLFDIAVALVVGGGLYASFMILSGWRMDSKREEL